MCLLRGTNQISIWSKLALIFEGINVIEMFTVRYELNICIWSKLMLVFEGLNVTEVCLLRGKN